MKKMYATKKTVLTIAGVVLPLAAAAVVLPLLHRKKKSKAASVSL